MSLRIKIKHAWNWILLQLSFFIFAFYLIIGLLFLFSDMWIDMVPKGRDIIGGSLVAFGILRFYIAFSRFKTKREKLHELKKQKKTQQEPHQHAEVN